MADNPDSSQVYYVGTMEGWYLESETSDLVAASHWVAFVVLLGTTCYLARESWTNRGPSKQSRFYAGYQEEQNIALFVNFFAMVSYYGKVVADSLDQNFHDVGPFILGFGNYRYADYMLTCPMLVYDLLFQLRAPYRVSLSVVIFAILLSGVIAELYSFGDPRLQNGAYAWYGFGLFWFVVAYGVVMTIVGKQYARLADLAEGTGAAHSLSTLKFALITFSLLWVLFPLVWALGPRGLDWIDEEVAEVVHCLCDIMAKSFYGWALARFRRVYDEELYQMLEKLGHDEEEFERIEKDIRLSSRGDRIRRLSVESLELRSSVDSQNASRDRGLRMGGRSQRTRKRSSIRSAPSRPLSPSNSLSPLSPVIPGHVTATSPGPRPRLAVPARHLADPSVEAGSNAAVEIKETGGLLGSAARALSEIDVELSGVSSGGVRAGGRGAGQSVRGNAQGGESSVEAGGGGDEGSLISAEEPRERGELSVKEGEGGEGRQPVGDDGGGEEQEQEVETREVGCAEDEGRDEAIQRSGADDTLCDEMAERSRAATQEESEAVGSEGT